MLELLVDLGDAQGLADKDDGELDSALADGVAPTPCDVHGSVGEGVNPHYRGHI